VTQIILGAVNVVTTFPGLYMVEKFGRRKCLSLGAAWMFSMFSLSVPSTFSRFCLPRHAVADQDPLLAVCYMVFASLGYFALENADGSNDETIGMVMIVFACLFIAAFASTWGPMAWAVTSEIYPSRYRSVCIALCAAGNW
jgi:MFS transporter, SP family, sugar:H+ symporter